MPNENTHIFLDRGFRDIYNSLKEDGFKVYIPTCTQLEECIDENIEIDSVQTKTLKKNVLTTTQTSNTRFVTKVIFNFVNNYMF